MIIIGEASWEVSLATTYLKCNAGEVYWEIKVFAGVPLVTSDELNFEPGFYSDYFGPLSVNGAKPFDDFGGLTIPNADEYVYKDGVSGFGCFIGSHVRTSGNCFRFGLVHDEVVDMDWKGFAPVDNGVDDELVAFSIKCPVRYTGMRVRETGEEEARSLLRTIDPVRSYHLEGQTTGLFKLVPADIK